MGLNELEVLVSAQRGPLFRKVAEQVFTTARLTGLWAARGMLMCYAADSSCIANSQHFHPTIAVKPKRAAVFDSAFGT